MGNNVHLTVIVYQYLIKYIIVNKRVCFYNCNNCIIKYLPKNYLIPNILELVLWLFFINNKIKYKYLSVQSK